LETLPSERLQLLDGCHHILLPIELADDGVELELDLELSAPVADAKQLLNILSSSATDKLVCLLVEAVTGHSHDIHKLAVLIQPLHGNFGAVRDDRDALQREHFLAILTQPSEFLRIEEWFTASKVDLAHTCFLQKSQAALHLLFGGHVRRFLGVEAEFASLVAPAREMKIDRNTIGTLCERTQVVDLDIEAKGKSEQSDGDEPEIGLED